MTDVLDLRGEVCPYTFVKTKLKMEDMGSGEQLAILLDDSEAMANVSRSLKSEGHRILDLKAVSAAMWQIVVIKSGQ